MHERRAAAVQSQSEQKVATNDDFLTVNARVD
jgi:hypothetical protein